MFEKVGKEISGSPYPAPRIVYWNLQGRTTGFAAQADTENVQMLSGFSPSMLDLVMSGDELTGVDKSSADPSEERAAVNPYQTFRAAVDKKEYDPVRVILNKSSERELSVYSFEPTVEEA